MRRKQSLLAMAVFVALPILLSACAARPARLPSANSEPENRISSLAASTRPLPTSSRRCAKKQRAVRNWSGTACRTGAASTRGP